MSRKRLIVLLVSGGIATIILLFVAPMPQHFAYSGATFGIGANIGCGGIDTTAGTPITFSWSAPGNVSFGVWSCSSHPIPGGASFSYDRVFNETGTSGSGTVTSHGGWYFFGAVCWGLPPCFPARVSGTYYGPIIPV